MPDQPVTQCALCNVRGGVHADYCPRSPNHPKIVTHEAEQERAALGDVCGPFTPEKNHFGKGGPIPGRRTALDYAAAHAELAARYAPIQEAALDAFYAAAHAELDALNAPAQSLPTSALARKELPLASGLLDYFPAALIAVAGLSRIGNEQHNPGQPLHWARGKSGDESDALLRHLVDRGTIDVDGVRHSTKVAWRALALLQKELEEAGLAPLSRGSR